MRYRNMNEIGVRKVDRLEVDLKYLKVHCWLLWCVIGLILLDWVIFQ